ncbi:MAG: nucleoside-diphosphate kinase [Patescibacteria group bacterium]
MKNERTLVLIKPDGVQRSLIGEIIKRYERSGLKLVALKFFVPDSETIKKHYLIDPEWTRKVGEKSIAAYEKKGMKAPFSEPVKCGEAVLGRLAKYLTSGPMVAMVWQGNKAVGIVRKITGGTEPLTSDVGTIRGDFTIDSYDLGDADERAIRNLIHASGSVDEANKEIALWFVPEEVINYRLVQEQILYDVNLDGILE